MDFTLTAYKQLISTLQVQGFFFQTFEGFIQNPEEKVLILRHDVDRLPGNSLKTARMENGLGIRASYYFRTIAQTFKPEIIKEIADLGHEIGYHYENLSEIGKNYSFSHRRTQTFIRQTSPDKKSHHFAEKRNLEMKFMNWRFVILREIWRNSGSYTR